MLGARVYVSRPTATLRRTARRSTGLRGLGHHASTMEDYVATDQRSLTKCL
jgi:hypothetical protein